MNIKILFENESVMAIDKPSGLTVNRSDTTTGEQTLQDFLEEKNKDILSKIDPIEQDFLSRAGIVHRLDKETSGVILVAKTPLAFRNLQAQFKERRVEKTYTALAHGYVNPEIGEIKVPVGRLPWNRKRFGVLAGGREAVTLYKVIKQFQRNNQNLSVLELYPKTGRTHQIRVHLKHLGYPIFGDTLYAGRKTARNDRRELPRLFLHASKISFFNPQDPQTLLTIESPLPDELRSFII